MSTALKPCDIIGGTRHPIDGESLVSIDPAYPDRVVWSGAPSLSNIDAATVAARSAFGSWAALSMEERAGHLQRWRDITREHVDELADLIAREVGKPAAEARIEASALGGKVDLTLERAVAGRLDDWSADAGANREGRCRYRPHGVMAVIGPFNFPAHLPNGQFVPALLAGNTVVFKPSELAPARRSETW